MAGKPRITEREVSRLALDWLKLRGYEVFRRNVGAVKREYKGKVRWVQFNETGQCDYWFVLPSQGGRHCELEIKRPDSWPKPEQVLYMLKMNSLGCAAFWINNIGPLERTVLGIEQGKHVVMSCVGAYSLAGPDEWERARTENYESMLILYGNLSKNTAGRRLPKLPSGKPSIFSSPRVTGGKPTS